MEKTYKIPTLENIKKQYEEIIGYMSKLKTKDDILEFQKRHGVPMEINYEECELYEEGSDDAFPIEVIRCESWGDLDYIYYPVDADSFYGSILEEPHFDVWCDFLEMDFIDCTTISKLEEDYIDGIKYILAQGLITDELLEVVQVLKIQGIDYVSLLRKEDKKSGEKKVMAKPQERVVELLENYIEYSKQYGYHDFRVWCEDNVDTVEENNLVEEIYKEVNHVADMLFRYRVNNIVRG